MKKVNVFIFFWMIFCPVIAQEEDNQQSIDKTIRKNDTMLQRFSRKCEKRTKKAERRFERYEKKIQKTHDSKNHKDFVFVVQEKPLNQDSRNGLGKEPLIDSLRLVYGFTDFTKHSTSNKSFTRAQKQLNITHRTKNELMQRKEYWKAQTQDHPKSGKWLSKMEKERYYFTVQINEYRKPLRDPSLLDDKLMNVLRRDPRWSDFAASLPARPQNQEKMQPRQLVQQMMQSQAAAIDPDPSKLLNDAKKKGADLLGSMSSQAITLGNLDNAAQIPKFTPNPYKTKNFWKRIDMGFNLQFDNRTYFIPATGIAGTQASFNFNSKFCVGILANYRFGMGEIKNIQFTHAGAGYGVFANYKVWKVLGVQTGYERNWRTDMEMGENLYPAAWSSSTLAGLTWEYGIGKKSKASIAVFYDFLYQRHTPHTNTILWRIGWKL